MVKMGTVWDRTAEFLTDNLGAVVPIALLAYFVPFSITGSFEYTRATATYELALVLQLVSLAFAVLAVWGSLTLIAMVLDSGGSGAGGTGGRRLVPALLVSVSLGLGAALLFAPALIALLAGGNDLAAISRGAVPDISPSVAGLALVNLLVALPLLFWLGARLVLLNSVIVAEKKMFGAIPRSWTLTRGVGLAVVGVLLLYAVVSLVATLATKSVFGSVFWLIAGPVEGLSLSGVLTSVMVAAVQTGFAVIAPVFTAYLYRALIAEREPAPAP